MSPSRPQHSFKQNLGIEKENEDEKAKDDNQISADNRQMLSDVSLQPNLKQQNNHCVINDKNLLELIVINNRNVEHTYAKGNRDKTEGICSNKIEKPLNSDTKLSEKTVPKLLIFSCNLCPVAYSSKSVLLKHKNVMHQALVEINCDKCFVSFVSKIHYENHQCSYYDKFLVNTGNNQQRYKCDQCSYITKKSNNQLGRFKKHYITHSDLLKMQCAHCPRKFRTRQNLKTHITGTHNKIKEYECQRCGKMFTTLEFLTMHHKVHEIKLSYQCHECSDLFQYKCELREHIKLIHLKVLDYRCSNCNKLFPTLAKLKNHKTLLMCPNQYICRYCNKQFSSNNWLRRHILSIHFIPRIKLILCILCNRLFLANRILEIHCLNIHNLVWKKSDPLPSLLLPVSLPSLSILSSLSSSQSKD